MNSKFTAADIFFCEKGLKHTYRIDCFGVLCCFQPFFSYIIAFPGYVTITTGPFIVTPASQSKC